MSQIAVKDLPDGRAKDMLTVFGNLGELLSKEQGLHLQSTWLILYGMAAFLSELDNRVKKLEINVNTNAVNLRQDKR